MQRLKLLKILQCITLLFVILITFLLIVITFLRWVNPPITAVMISEKENIKGNNIIIATGSKPFVPSSFNFDKTKIITSTEALSLKEIPKKLIIVGAGVIGLELGSVYARMGTKVSVVDISSNILSTMLFASS